MPVIVVGSSPRPWGTLEGCLGPACTGRFIPTPVGNTSTFGLGIPSLAVHPHARGEHQHTSPSAQVMTGSSPRPWGTRVVVAVQIGGDRFIPTPVGNTVAAATAAAAAAVHPHARGEHILLSQGRAITLGSSPRPWGTLRFDIHNFPADRFIPTPVGNTNSVDNSSRLIAVHPHARGEHLFRQPVIIGRTGSSPRPWGTHL